MQRHTKQVQGSQSAGSKVIEQKKQVEEEKKEQSNKQEAEEDDEESQFVEVKVRSAQSKTASELLEQEELRQKEKEEMKSAFMQDGRLSDMKNNYVVFLGTDFVYTDSASWQFGQLAEPTFIPQNCSLVQVDLTKIQNNQMQLIFSGGFHNGAAQSQAGSLIFTRNEAGGMVAGSNSILTPLRFQRFSHQSQIIKKNNAWHLVVIGGKHSKTGWLKLVDSLDLTYFLFPNKIPQDLKDSFLPETVQWESCSPMKSERSNFASIVVNNLIYVFGGISGKQAQPKTPSPQISLPLIEQYDPSSDKWTEIKIQNTPSIAAFAWTQIEEGKIVTVGGTDGNLLTNDTWSIDFVNKESKLLNLYLDEGSTCLGHLFSKGGKLTLVGGKNIGGTNYQVNFEQNEGEWRQMEEENSHLKVMGMSADVELLFNEGVFFK